MGNKLDKINLNDLKTKEDKILEGTVLITFLVAITK